MASRAASPFTGPTVGTTTRMRPDQLATFHKNPRRGDVGAIAASLRAHSQYKPITANIGTHTGRPNEVLAGNHTLMAFRTLLEADAEDGRWSDILVHWVDVDDDMAERIVVADNRASEVGTTDNDALLELLKGRTPDVLQGMGYTSDQVTELAALVAPPRPDDDDDDDDDDDAAPPVPKPEPRPRYDGEQFTLHHGDSLAVIKTLADESVDAVVTDPPYGLDFMGKAWDDGVIVFHPELWREVLRVLRPGGHLVAFGGTRTWHRLAVAVEDAGFDIRDNLAWLYGSGFPKSLDVSKAIDAAAGAERTKVRVTASNPKAIEGGKDGMAGGTRPFIETALERGYHETADGVPVTDETARWQGWGTALKPSFEPIVLARKPLTGTVAATVLEHGTGALNIDSCRVGTEERVNQPGSTNPRIAMGDGWREDAEPTTAVGRWPANTLLDPFAAAEVDAQSGTLSSGANPTRRSSDKFRDTYGDFAGQTECVAHRGADEGGASRFFPVFQYSAKAATSERPKDDDGTAHPTVKPLELMRWLVRLVTPPKGVVLEPFAGSGTTVEACLLEGMACVAVEREADYIPLIVQRIERAGGTVDVS